MPLVFPKRQSFESDLTHPSSRNINLRLADADTGLIDYNKDFFKLLVCAIGMVLHACILVVVDIVELTSMCTRISLGIGLLDGMATLVGAMFCLTIHFSNQLRHSLRWIRMAFVVLAVVIVLHVGNFVRFYSTVSFNLVQCSFAMKIALGSPTIVSVIVGIPAAFVAAAILWNLRSWLGNVSHTIPVKTP